MTENTMPLGEVSPTSQKQLTSFSQVTIKRTDLCQHWFACCDCLLGENRSIKITGPNPRKPSGPLAKMLPTPTPSCCPFGGTCDRFHLMILLLVPTKKWSIPQLVLKPTVLSKPMERVNHLPGFESEWGWHSTPDFGTNLWVKGAIGLSRQT